jgi:tetratricopeptide (TPR) repeat protein
MAKTPSKPAKKAQPKAKSASIKPPKKAAKAVKPAPKAAATKAKAKAKSVKVVAAVKPVKTKEKAAVAKTVKAKSKPTVKVAKKPAAKPLSKAAAKPVKVVKTAKPVKAAKPVQKAAVKAAKTKAVAPNVKNAKAAPPKVVAKSSGKAIAVKPDVKTLTKKSQTGALTKPAVIETAPVGKVGKAVHASSKALARRLAQLPPPPPPPPMLPPEPPRRTVTPAALRAFDHAVKVFNRQHFAEAKSLFESLEQKFPLDGELIGRAQVYIQACARKLTHAPAPRVVSADDFYDQGVHALNNGDYAQARQCFEKALKINPNEPDFMYSLAAAHAQTGSHEQALDYLARSIQIKPRFRSQAYDDNDFLELRENRQFQELLGLTSPFELLDQRR